MIYPLRPEWTEGSHAQNEFPKFLTHTNITWAIKNTYWRIGLWSESQLRLPFLQEKLVVSPRVACTWVLLGSPNLVLACLPVGHEVRCYQIELLFVGSYVSSHLCFNPEDACSYFCSLYVPIKCSRNVLQVKYLRGKSQESKFHDFSELKWWGSLRHRGDNTTVWNTLKVRVLEVSPVLARQAPRQ